MQNRDLLKDEIERVGKVLAKILSEILGLQSSNNANDGIEITNQQLKDELDIDVAAMLELPKNALQDFLIKRNFIAAHIEYLSDYFGILGKKQTEAIKKQAYLLKAVELLDIADDSFNTMSLQRMNKKTQLQELLSQNG